MKRGKEEQLKWKSKRLSDGKEWEGTVDAANNSNAGVQKQVKEQKDVREKGEKGWSKKGVCVYHFLDEKGKQDSKICC